MTFQADCHALQQAPIFKDIDPAKLKLVAVASQRVMHTPGEMLLTEGDPPSCVLVILEGTASVHRKASSGENVQIARVGAGETVGEMGVLTGRAVSATVVAETELAALQIERNAFLEIMQTVPHIALAVARELSRRLDKASKQIAELTSR